MGVRHVLGTEDMGGARVFSQPGPRAPGPEDTEGEGRTCTNVLG